MQNMCCPFRRCIRKYFFLYCQSYNCHWGLHTRLVLKKTTIVTTKTVVGVHKLML